MKKIIFICILVSILQLITGCQVGGSKSFIQGTTPEENNAAYTGEPVTGDWVITDLLDEPEGLNPFTSSSASATNIYNYIYESFLQQRREPPWDYIPLLVDAPPTISEDHLVYEWRLLPNITWHDGKPLTMRDAEFTLKAIMNPYVDDLPTKPYYMELDSIYLADDFSMIMYCSQPYFLHIEFLGGFSILPEHVFDPDGMMKNLTYYQVKNGSYFGYVADVLENQPDVGFEELDEAVALNRLEKSIEGVTSGEIKWDDVSKAVPDLKSLSIQDKLTRIKEFISTKENGSQAIELLNNASTSTTNLLMTLSLGRELSRSVGKNRYPGELGKTCREIHDRIKKFGEMFNLHEHNRKPTIGSGPYIFESWTTGQEIVLKRNDNYWKGPGYSWLDKIVWRVLTDYTASLVALKNGEIDFMEHMQTLQYLTMTNQKKFLDSFIKATYVIPNYSYIGWRNTHPLFSDPNVRRAMTHMIRREEFRDKILFGFAEIVNSNFYRYGMDYDTTLVPYSFDPDSAQYLLKAAGWADVDNDGILEKDSLEFKFELLLPSGSTDAEKLASIMREDLFMIGVEMEIRRLEWSVFINNYIRNHDFDACYLGWVFGMTGDPKQVWHSESAKGRGSNHIEFMNSHADSIIDEARVEFDQEKRVAMYREFQRILHEQQPYTFLFSPLRKPGYAKRFRGVKFYPFRPGYQFDEWFVPKEEQKY